MVLFSKKTRMINKSMKQQRMKEKDDMRLAKLARQEKLLKAEAKVEGLKTKIAKAKRNRPGILDNLMGKQTIDKTGGGPSFSFEPFANENQVRKGKKRDSFQDIF